MLFGDRLQFGGFIPLAAMEPNMNALVAKSWKNGWHFLQAKECRREELGSDDLEHFDRTFDAGDLLVLAMGKGQKSQ